VPTFEGNDLVQDMKILIEHQIENLRIQGFRITPIVVSVLNQFYQNHQVMSILEIKEEISRVLGYEVGNPTIYRICERLHQAGILRAMHSPDGVSRYYVCSNPTDHKHLHFICLQCKQVLEVDFSIEEKVHAHVSEKLDAEVKNQFIQVEGVCKRCRT
jgi:Fe2+ or Zn2+ uptake regulation protein